ncbi:MAG TPA: DUF1572 family protein [Coriobacteriia bacterium]
MDPAGAFLEEARRYLAVEYPAKIRACLARLSDDDIWWRPNEASNSIGNLLLHLSGNLRQWIVSGVGGAPDVRRRQEEFDERGPVARAELLARFDATLADAERVLLFLGAAELTAPRRIQGRDTTVLLAIFHVVEHFAMHTGQIALITKQRSGYDLGFYRDAGGLAIDTWQERAREHPTDESGNRAGSR